MDDKSLISIYGPHCRGFAFLNEMRRQSQLCDVTLVAGDDQKELVAHRAVLAATSPYFHARFTANANNVLGGERITFRGIDAASLTVLLDHLYTDSVAAISDANVQPLLGAAGLLQLPLLRDACTAHLAATLTPDTCLRIRRAADRHDCATLRRQADEYILLNSVGLVQSEDFGRLMATGQASTLDAPDAVVTIDAPVKKVATTDADNVANGTADRMSASSMLVVDEFRSQMYDFAEERWGRSTAGRPGGKIIYAAVLYQAKLYTFEAGENVEVLKMDTGVWKKHNDLKITSQFTGVDVLNGTWYAVGGQSSSTSMYCVRQKEWNNNASMSQKRAGPGVAVLNNQLYAVGGFPDLTSAERYTVDSESWQSIADMSVGRFRPGMAVLDGMLYAVGGSIGTNERPLKSAEVYNPTTNSWSRLEDMSVERARPAVVVHAGELYVMGGTFDRQVEVFSPAMGIWRTLPTLMPEASLMPVACLAEKRAWHGKATFCPHNAK